MIYVADKIQKYDKFPVLPRFSVKNNDYKVLHRFRYLVLSLVFKSIYNPSSQRGWRKNPVIGKKWKYYIT